MFLDSFDHLMERINKWHLIFGIKYYKEVIKSQKFVREFNESLSASWRIDF